MALLSPVTETARGFHVFVRGFRWLRAHPKYLTLLFIPMLLGFVGLILGMQTFMSYDKVILGWILFAEPTVWYLQILYWVSYVILYLAAIVTTLLGAMLMTNVIAAPFYEIVSVAIEKDMRGTAGEELGLMGNIKIMLVELKKVAFILLINVLFLFVPFINIIAILVTAFLVGWDFFDYPVARRDWTFGNRLSFVLKHFWSVTGLGLWLIVPVLNFVLMPLAVAGGTILNLEALEKRELSN